MSAVLSRCLSRALLLLCLAGAMSASAGEPELRRYLNIRASAGPGLSPDGRQLTFVTNVTGVMQLWGVPVQGGWPEQLTFYDEPVKGASWSPTGEWLLFSLDNGGAENYQLYLMSPDGTRVEPITTDTSVRNEAGTWSHDGRQVAYASNQRNRGFFDLVTWDLATRAAKAVFQSDDYNVPADWSRDGKYLLFQRQISNFDEDLFVLELATGKATRLNTDKEAVRYEYPQFAPDGRSVYVVTDLGRDFMTPARIDIATKKVTPLSDTKWDAEWLALSPDGRWLAVSYNEEGASRLEVTDLTTNQKVSLPALPVGDLGGPVFAEHAPVFALSLSGPKYTSDVWVVDLEHRTVNRVTRSGLSGLSQDSFVEPQVVRYKTFDGKEIPGLLYLPAGAAKDGRLPAVVKMHGGPEGQATRIFNGFTQYLVAAGYAVLEPNVRGSTGYGKAYSHLDDVRKREDSVKDMGAAAAYLTQSGYVDPKKIAVIGGSYGGFMVLAALTSQPELWAAGIDIVGIANFKTFLNNTSAYRRALRIAEYGDPVKDAEFLDRVSPLHHVDRIRAPLMVIQGANDPRVPQSEADQIVDAVKKKGGVVEYLLLGNEGHGIAKLPNRTKVTEAEVEFLNKHVRGR